MSTHLFDRNVEQEERSDGKVNLAKRDSWMSGMIGSCCGCQST